MLKNKNDGSYWICGEGIGTKQKTVSGEADYTVTCSSEFVPWKLHINEDFIGMKKTAIVSCYFQHNYGSMLQAYATQMALDKLGYENETIDISGFNGEIKKAKLLYFAKASLTSDSWNSEANAAHDIRLKRNLVHPVKFVVENPTVNRDTCLQVLREMQSILISRGFENGFTIPAN